MARSVERHQASLKREVQKAGALLIESASLSDSLARSVKPNWEGIYLIIRRRQKFQFPKCCVQLGILGPRMKAEIRVCV
jgi:hypothetical protein